MSGLGWAVMSNFLRRLDVHSDYPGYLPDVWEGRVMEPGRRHGEKQERLIHLDEVAHRYGIHPKTAIRFAKEGKIPAPLKASFAKRPCWRESVIDRHLESLE